MHAFAPATRKPQDPWKTGILIVAALAFCMLPLLACFADEADAKARTANAKVVSEIADQPILPDTAPDIDLSIKKISGTADPVPPPVEFRPIDATVKIVGTSGGKERWGSGTVVDGGILTCSHIFTADTANICVECMGETSIATIHRIDYVADLAFLKVDWATPKPTAYLARSLPKEHETITSCGRKPEIHELVAEEHRVIGFERSDGHDKILYSPMPYPGRSGGGLFNADGDLIGVIQAKGAWGIAGTVLDARDLIESPEPGRRIIIATAAQRCMPCRVFKKKNGDGNADYGLIYADIDSVVKPPSVTVEEWALLMADKPSRPIPFAIWQDKKGKWYAATVGGFDMKEVARWVEHADKEGSK